MKQTTLTDFEYGLRKKTTKREEFLRAMDAFIPWAVWISLIEPYYPDGKRGRKPRGIEIMLRMYLLQCWFNLSDEGIEEAIYDSYAFRMFMGINFFDEQVPDATTLLKFRHLLEKNGIAEQIFEAIKLGLEECGCIMHGGSIVDASIIQAPSSTKNAAKGRDPEMKSTKKGNQYHFGLKAHIGVDAGSGYVHTMKVTSANVHDVTVASELLRPDDHTVYGDSGYIGLEKREEILSNPDRQETEFRINKRYGSVKKAPAGHDWDRQIEKGKSRVRSHVEHPFHIVKQLFGYTKARYKGLYKNAQRLYILFGSANLLMSIWAARKGAA